ncbi:aldehyde dehydrogenase EutE [Aestuariimicrobium sp. p3-SID1156]|uniref:aldehyde dehydrogenase family protein n=1 Tax=Aestuariimicrobium sp. p3-SID1156 TaxID=2916038 RepID=UPI00223A8F99|nr:aldehyde dehydrogenase family protein [Aestuariimicrobium sp. p3-SID1156]MCT1458351.1 aldehyde dehydrogenase EutE [Aestuariimicrobium sp. p3-SID1156]
MDADKELIATLVGRIMEEITAQQSAGGQQSAAGQQHAGSSELGIFESMDDAVAAAEVAQRQYLECKLEARRRYVEAIREVSSRPEHLEYMARCTVEETGMGNVEHKIIKNRYAAEGTPGVEDLVTDAWSGDDGLTTVEYSAYGVIGAITPTTNPTETVICNSIGMLAAGNSVVFSPHPRAKKITLWLVQEINKALAKEGAPANLVVTVREPSIENTNAMMAHPGVRMLVATGGPGIVKAVMSTGKKAIGAGAGNPPVLVDATADIEKAAQDIVDGASFDNNLPCTAEKEVIACDAIADLLRFEMTKCGAHEITDAAQLKALEDLVLKEGGSGPRTEWVGKDAAVLLEAIGVTPRPGTRLIIAEVDKDHPFVQHELMMPILGIVRVPDVDTGIELAIELEHGNRHTAIMHSRDVTKLTKMGRLIQTTIFVKNGPSFAGLGIGGEGFSTFTIAGPTGEGLTSARSFARRRRCVLVGELNVR